MAAHAPLPLDHHFQAAQELEQEQWMQGPDGWDPVETAGAGRLDCLQCMHKAGRFLDLYSPHRAAAGEARKAEAWLAALAACKAGHAHVLRWLFRGGWPGSYDARVPWHLRDMAESWIKLIGTVPEQGLWIPEPGEWPLWLQSELACFRPEVELYRAAMRAPACLDALLEARARSPWICRAAVLVGRADLLRLAVAHGCPCDAWCLLSAARHAQVEVLEELLGMGVGLLMETTNRLFPNNAGRGRQELTAASLVLEAGAEAAARPQSRACLEALLRWHPDLLCGCNFVAHAAAHAGNLSYLQILDRAGFREWRGTIGAAAGRPDNLPCIQFALSREDRQDGDVRGYKYALVEAARGGSLPNLKALHEAGLPWTGEEVPAAVGSSNLDAVNFCLECCLAAEYMGAWEIEGMWCEAMETAIEERSPAMMELLYEAGYPPGGGHPAVLAIAAGMLEGAQIAVKYSGMPELQRLDLQSLTIMAAKQGEALLRYAHELGGTLHEGTVAAATRSGQLGALRYAIQNGSPWDESILVTAMESDSLDCVRYVHEAGCLQHTPGEPLFVAAAKSLPVLRYVCEHMGPPWSAEVLRITVMHLANSISWAEGGERLDWRMALYTVQQFLKSGEPGMLWEDLPAPLAEAVEVRRERAAALAGAFFKAGQLGRAHAAHSQAPLWCSMAALPCNIREKIAYMAHLVLPPAPLR